MTMFALRATVGAVFLMLLLLSVASRRAAAEAAVLVTTTVAGYAPGRVISDDETLTLPDGASLTLLFRSGQMLRLRGPFQGKLQWAQPQDATTDISALVQLFRLRGVGASVIGGTRDWRPTGTRAAPIPPPGGVVLINPSHSATYCITPSDRIRIVRPADDRSVYGMRRRGRLQMIAWAGDADWTEWPDDPPIEDRDRVEIVAGGKPEASISFRTLGARFSSRTAWIAAGILAGCHEQFDAELHTLGRATW